jgi:hypothetical protein
MGIAVDGPQGGDGAYTTVFYNRVKESAHRSRLSEASVLSCAIAHEFGHLLLGARSHSLEGIMRARWKPEDLRHALLGNVHFTDGQEEAIRRSVAARVPRR